MVFIPITIKVKTNENYIKIINYDKLKSILDKEKWISVYTSNSVNFCLYAFRKTITNAVNDSITYKYKQLKEWMFKGLLCFARRKQYLSLKCKKTQIT